MKNSGAIKNIIILALLVATISGCNLELIKDEAKVVIKDAPEWVNNGSRIEGANDGRVFKGVSSASLRGDMALQKSLADDKSLTEVARVLSSYLEAVSNDYLMSASKSSDYRGEEGVPHKISETASRQINESVMSQIDDAIARQFKSAVPPQFRSEISRVVKEMATRKIRAAVSNQVDFLLELEDDILIQLKEAVSLQIKKSTKVNMAGAQIIESWRDPKTNMIWSHSELDMKYVKSTIEGISDMNVDLKHYFERNAEEVFDRLIRERDNVNPFSQLNIYIRDETNQKK